MDPNIIFQNADAGLLVQPAVQLVDRGIIHIVISLPDNTKKRIGR